MLNLRVYLYLVIVIIYWGFEPLTHHWWSVQFRIAACVYYYKNYWYRGIVYPHEVWWLPLLEVAFRLFLCVCLLLTLLHYFSVYRWILYWFNPIQVRACHGSYHLASNSAIYQKELKIVLVEGRVPTISSTLHILELAIASSTEIGLLASMSAFNCLYYTPTGRLPTIVLASFSIYSYNTIYN